MTELHDWFYEHQRPFPWRVERSPYKVWISEVMLQQTRAIVVIPYFKRWMTLFPSVQALAEAPLELVIKAWEGLGYYSRARFLHQAAQQIMQKFGGALPDTREGLMRIKGLGPYTVGAILSFGFYQRAAAIDGNVTRVLSRYFQIEEPIHTSRVKKQLELCGEAILDAKEPWVTAEALIELGAKVCRPVPRCGECPLQGSCQALQSGRAAQLPIKPARTETIHLKRMVACIESGGYILVSKGGVGKVMADLYEFPYFEVVDLCAAVAEKFGLATYPIVTLPKVRHSFTRYIAHLFPVHLAALERPTLPPFEWVAKEQLQQLPFSSGHKKILANL